MSNSDTETVEAMELAKEEVLTKLRQVEIPVLTEICVELNLTIPIKKVGIKSALVNLIVKHLLSEAVEESDDGGAQILANLKTKLDGKIGTDPVNGTQTVKVEETAQQGNSKTGKQPMKKTLGSNAGDSGDSKLGAGGSSSTSVDTSSTTVEETETALTASRLRADIKLKEFKIHSGTIGGENQLDLEEVLYQINEGKALGYKVREIVSGVIRATKPGSSLRKYCQSRPDLKFETLVSQLRSHYGTEDSQEMLE